MARVEPLGDHALSLSMIGGDAHLGGYSGTCPRCSPDLHADTSVGAPAFHDIGGETALKIDAPRNAEDGASAPFPQRFTSQRR
jgi:hypothetical protein